MFKALFYLAGGSMLGNTIKQHKLRKEREDAYNSLYKQIALTDEDGRKMEEYIDLTKMNQIEFLNTILIDKSEY